jgi:tellurite methyltransferase
MEANRSVTFFDEQFRRQLAAADFALNPFESAALPHLHGHVLDYGCGLGNLALAAARGGCTVLALDASAAAIEHLRAVAAREALPLCAEQADLRRYRIGEDFDAVVCIGLLMFFDCASAKAQLAQLQLRVRPGGVAVLNVLTEGTTYLDMFAPGEHCLFGAGELRAAFERWEILSHEAQEFPAPRGTRKVFATVVARRPLASPLSPPPAEHPT